MPHMNGREFLEAKRRNDAIAAIPVCIVSGVADEPDVSNVVGFVKKPVEFDGLLKFIRQYCGVPSVGSQGT